MRRYPAADAAAPTLLFAHGAGAGESHPWMTRVAGGLAARGIHVVTFNFPYKDTGRSLPDPMPALEAAFATVWKDSGAVFAGGKSMGGRVASLAAAKAALSPPPAGLVYFGYPLHPPAKPAQRRDAHLPDIHAPMLFLHGTKDPFGTPDEMTTLVARLGDGARLELVEGGDHSLARSRRQDPEGRSVEGAMDVAAEWMRALA